jgi:hypothetical protein
MRTACLGYAVAVVAAGLWCRHLHVWCACGDDMLVVARPQLYDDRATYVALAVGAAQHCCGTASAHMLVMLVLLHMVVKCLHSCGVCASSCWMQLQLPWKAAAAAGAGQCR